MVGLNTEKGEELGPSISQTHLGLRSSCFPKFDLGQLGHLGHSLAKVTQLSKQRSCILGFYCLIPDSAVLIPMLCHIEWMDRWIDGWILSRDEFSYMKAFLNYGKIF